MKQLKDYLPFYLGCDYWTNNSQGNLNEETLSNVIDMCDRNKGVQIHLRPLSDMTDNETVEVVKAFKKNLHETAGNAGLLKADAEQTRFLLSKHFDLFGLIEAGLAIDATTLKTVNQ